jgi:hypothetical protein
MTFLRTKCDVLTNYDVHTFLSKCCTCIRFPVDYFCDKKKETDEYFYSCIQRVNILISLSHLFPIDNISYLIISAYLLNKYPMLGELTDLVQTKFVDWFVLYEFIKEQAIHWC